MGSQARTEFSSALNAIANERGLDPAVILDTIKQAILAAYKRDIKEYEDEDDSEQFEVVVDPQSGEAQILSWEEGKEDKKKDVTPPGFGRIAAQTAKQVIVQKIREAEREAVLSQYQERIGSLVSGVVLRFDGANVRVDIGRTEGVMLPQDRVPNERLSLNQRLNFLLKEIREGERGREVLLSRADPAIVEKLFAREVPEISSGSVEIRKIAREAGSRTKIAVVSTQSGVDPVGSCVGQKGVRVQAVINELGGEKIDVIAWTDNSENLITAALAPAEGISVVFDEKKQEAKIKVPEDQLSLAIGREGQNVRLASKLTGWKIEIEGIPEPKKKKKKKDDETDEKKEVKPKSDTKKEKETKTKKVKTKKAKPKPEVKKDTKEEQDSSSETTNDKNEK
ncbi:transcription termination/antitermination protein NusA [Candidatus Woesebacteria bacterium]|nr:transcription termination/antitermination protein NusA [Candidatus Woesebacteria bacterium]